MDLISKSALIRHFKKGGEVGIKTGASPELVEIVLRGVIGQIIAEPEVDAVEVVRCKDCIYHEDEDLKTVYCPNIVGGWVDYDFYCRDGKEKSNG